MNNIERWIHHVNEVICAGDEESIKYIHAWIARPLQNPLKKNKTALIIKDTNQGTGKSWFAEVVAHLHGKFGNENIGDMKNICGNFNGLIDNQTLIVVNELENADNSLFYNDSRLKDLISEDKVSIEYKGVDAKSRDIFANFIFISNNEMPIRITDKDRRYVVLRPSALHGKEDYDYWSDSFYCLKTDTDFLAQLYSYYMELDIGYYNPRAIPKTLALTELIEQSRPRIHDFIMENYDLFVKGWIAKHAFDDYLDWCRRNNYQNPGSTRALNNNLREYVEWKTTYPNGKNKPAALKLPQKKVNGMPVCVYKLNEQYIEYFKPDDDSCSDEEMEPYNAADNGADNELFE
jgi:putative DNA primase/helicase